MDFRLCVVVVVVFMMRCILGLMVLFVLLIGLGGWKVG